MLVRGLVSARKPWGCRQGPVMGTFYQDRQEPLPVLALLTMKAERPRVAMSCL